MPGAVHLVMERPADAAHHRQLLLGEHPVGVEPRQEHRGAERAADRAGRGAEEVLADSADPDGTGKQENKQGDEGDFQKAQSHGDPPGRLVVAASMEGAGSAIVRSGGIVRR